MTEKQVRQVVVNQARTWLGRNEGDGSHRLIVDIYNSQITLPRGYKVKYTDAWCATFVSAVALQTGLEKIMPTECGCEPMIRLYKQMDSWVEDDAYVPKPGDVIFYDWDDTGTPADDKGEADHVGIVEDVQAGLISVIEGNLNDAVRRRAIRVDAKGIRGYGAPRYWMYASDEEEEAEEVKRYNSLGEMPEWARPAIAKLIDRQALTGGGREYDDRGRPADLDLSMDMIRTFVVLNRLGLFDR